MLPKKLSNLAIIVLGLFLFGISVFGLIFTIDAAKGKTPPANNEINESKSYTITGPKVVKVILERHYLDGEISEQELEETIWSMQDFWAKYESWQLIDQEEGQLVFKREIDDISPLLKSTGYFGITEDGILSIFKGKPDSENVIQSFFQIDMKKLQSRQHKELKDGIRILSKDQYLEVLESFKAYSLTKDMLE